MDVNREDFDWAVGEGLLSEEQADRLWSALRERRDSSAQTEDSSWFDLASVAYYGGALVVIVAMCWFMIRVSEEFGHASLMWTALVYGGVFAAVGTHLRFRKGLQVAGGLLIVLAVAMVPVVLYSLERATGLWGGVHQMGQWLGFFPVPAASEMAGADPYAQLRQNWFFEEIGTVAAGALALRYVRFPFLTAPIAFALWAMAAISVPDLMGDPAWETRLWVSVGVGTVMLAGAYLVDRRTEADYAFWGYLFGLLAFWGGLSLMRSGTEWEYLLYCVLNIFLVLMGVFLERRAFLVFGALGVFVYLGHLSYEVFSGSVFFPLVLSLIGVGLIYLGVKYQQNRTAIERFFWSSLPPGLRQLSPRRR